MNDQPMLSADAPSEQGAAGARCSLAKGSALQRAIRELIARRARNGCMSLTRIAENLRSNRLACSAALRSMERRGEAGYFRSPPGDRWSAQMWYLREPNDRDEPRGRKL